MKDPKAQRSATSKQQGGVTPEALPRERVGRHNEIATLVEMRFVPFDEIALLADPLEPPDLLDAIDRLDHAGEGEGSGPS